MQRRKQKKQNVENHAVEINLCALLRVSYTILLFRKAKLPDRKLSAQEKKLLGKFFYVNLSEDVCTQISR